MTQRYQKYFREASVKQMELIVDDARGLTLLSSESVGGGVLDKGLVDVLHCSTGNGNNDDAAYILSGTLSKVCTGCCNHHTHSYSSVALSQIIFSNGHWAQ
jgi:hypothetical protein